MRGPIDYVVVGFPGNKFKGEIFPELTKLVSSGMIHVIDLMFVTKDEAGNVVGIEIDDMPQEIVELAASVHEELTGLLSEEDVEEIGNTLDNNSSAGILVFEHLWAKPFKEAIVNAGGELIADGRIHDAEIEAAMADLKSSK